MNVLNDSLLFKRNSAIDIRYFLLILLSIFIMVVDSRHHALMNIRNGFSFLALPAQYIANYPSALYENIKFYLKSNSVLRVENDALKKEQYKLVAKLQQFHSLQKENNRLRALLKSSPNNDEELTIASLLSVATDPFQQTIRLAKGKRDHVEMGQPVLDDSGVLGQVMRVGSVVSDVLLITDIRSAVPVMNVRSGIRSIAVGTNYIDALKLLHISNVSNVREGDLFVTSGMGQRFPEGHPVGIVEKITKLPGDSFAEVTLRPAAKIERARFVLLVKTKVAS